MMRIMQFGKSFVFPTAFRRSVIAAALLAAPARADLSFVQVTQAQTSAGAEGLFGKTWVELRGSQMRLVSGYARKVKKGGGNRDPMRRVQILDVKERTRTVLDPAAKAYAVGALTPPDYGNGLKSVLERGAPEWKVLSREVRLERQSGIRRFLGADCEHWKVTVKLRLSALGGREESARMDQHLWVAPLAGPLAKTIFELIAFENSYREGAGGALSPLDHERYQVREAASYLRVPPADLAGVVAAVRERLRELPSYPVASSVSWWRDEGRDVRPPEPPKPEPGVPLGKVKAKKIPPAPAPHAQLVRAAPRRLFKIIDWRKAEKRINGMYERTRSEFGDFPLGGLEAPRAAEAMPEHSSSPVFPRFEEELKRILRELIAEEAKLELPPEAKAVGPFFEIYAELHGLERQAVVAAGHFKLPDKHRRLDSLPSGT